MKRILIVLDGAADKLSNKTPFELAKTPNLDYLTKKGKIGYMYVIKENIAPESDYAVFSILGYNPDKYYPGRGPLEAYGMGISFKQGYLVLRTNFATVKNNKIIDRRAGRNLTTKEAKVLEKAINKKVKLKAKFLYKNSIGHRGVLIIKKQLSSNISNVDPAYLKKGKLSIALSKKDTKLKRCRALDNKNSSKEAASLINEFIKKSIPTLDKHYINKIRNKKGLLKANLILPRDAGNSLPKLPKLKGKWAAITAMPLEIGISKLAGMKILKFNYKEIKTKNVYKHFYENLKLSINYSLKYLKNNWNKFDNFYIHIKEIDITGHDGKLKDKIKMIELIDKLLISKIKNYNAIICVTSDHATPYKLKSHSSDPVPVLIYGKNSDKIRKFDERSALKGSVGKIYGKNLIKLIA